LLEMTGVTRYASLWCPDFPPHKSVAIRRSALQIYNIYGFRMLFYVKTLTQI